MSDTAAAAPAPEAAAPVAEAVAVAPAAAEATESTADADAPAETAAAPEAADTEAAAPVPAAEAPAVPEVKTKDADAIKLFVGQIPRQCTAEMLLPMFEAYGEVFEWSLLTDRMTGLHKGCGFLTYKGRLSALAAMDALHDKKKLDGANRPIQVKPADSEASKANGGADEPENTKLFIGMLSRTMDEAGLRAMFGAYGTLEDAMILKNLDDGSSKGCGFVRFTTKSACIAAIQGLHGNQTTEGNHQPLVVKFADTPREKAQRRTQKMGGAQQQQWGGQQAYQQQPQQQQWGQQQQQYNQYGQQQGYQQQGQVQQYAQQQQMGYAPQMQQPMAGQDQQQQGAAAQSYGPDGGNLFLYHLPNEWSDIDVINAFTPYGRVVSAKVFIDKATGLSKCFGFVSYDNSVSAQNAIQSMNGFQVAAGKRLRVQLKRPKGEAGPGAMGQQQYPQKPY